MRRKRFTGWRCTAQGKSCGSILLSTRRPAEPRLMVVSDLHSQANRSRRAAPELGEALRRSAATIRHRRPNELLETTERLLSGGGRQGGLAMRIFDSEWSMISDWFYCAWVPRVHRSYCEIAAK